MDYTNNIYLYSIMDLEKQISTNITDLDLNRYFPETKSDNHHVIKYSELANVNSIYGLLPKDMSYKIILIEEEPNKGHWVCILRYGRTIEAFDSYGGTIDNELQYIPEVMKRMLGEDKKHLGRLLRDVKDRQVIYSKKRLQKLQDGINTCGRWVILRILMMKEFFYTLQEFLDFIEKTVEETGMSTDELVASWII